MNAPRLPRLRSLGSFALGLLLLAGHSGCATTGLRRFALEPVLWEDDDQRLFTPAPEGFYSPYMWDGADNSFFRPVSEFWLFEPSRPAINVNAVDEVPDSSWFTNRLSRRMMSPEAVGRGACPEDFEMPAPWTIVAGKPDGANPGFQIEDANGVRYLLKTEGELQPWRPGAADTIGAAIYHAAGYWAPCNRVVHFDVDVLERDPDATIERSNGDEEPLRDHHVQAVLEAALQLPDGRYRASVSRFVDGRPISAWRYEGTRDDDPNDVVPHQHRRETRGMYVLAAWTDHIDSRQENTMAAWMTPEGSDAGYVRHYMIDFGDCFGVVHSWGPLVRRFGHSGYLDFEHVFTDLVTLDLLPRPWFHAQHGPAGDTLGYYDVFRFEPDRWRPGYPNPAFDRHTEADAAWMARIIARFRDPHVRALVSRGRFLDPVHESELARVLIGRRDRILERYLTRLSPLTWPYLRPSEAGGQELCMQDLAVWSGIRTRRTRRYSAKAYVAADGSGAESGVRELDPPPLHAEGEGYVCAPLPALESTPGEPSYVLVDVVAQTPGRETTFPARAHLYHRGDEGYRLAGLERPESREVPGR
ncbi:MAG TPA: hypothetical protein RMH99_31260 [Sandaracinaceae bacterium LLY-WYZ-13_1]|nr:hypothetical protein [Sandaracinaceae bacterium LLY-WYZ-13_1]